MQGRSARVIGWLVLAISFSVTSSHVSPAQERRELTVAAAADLAPVLKELASEFKKQTGVEPKIILGASGNLATQIENGAPFDVFLSADMDYPQRLVTAGLADRRTLFAYARGRVVVWVPSQVQVDLQGRGMDALLDPRIARIAIANPKHAPYGRAAEAALRSSGVYDRVSSKLVVGENVAQAAQFVESGNAQAGLIAITHALAPHMRGKGKYWIVPTTGYPAMLQGAVVLKDGSGNPLASQFLQMLRGPRAVSLLSQHGVESVEGARRQP